jgi:hypothetical protein
MSDRPQYRLRDAWKDGFQLAGPVTLVDGVPRMPLDALPEVEGNYLLSEVRRIASCPTVYIGRAYQRNDKGLRDRVREYQRGAACANRNPAQKVLYEAHASGRSFWLWYCARPESLAFERAVLAKFSTKWNKL